MEEQNNNGREAILSAANALRWEVGNDLHTSVVETIYQDAARIAERAVVSEEKPKRFDWDRTLDRLLTHRMTGFPIMLLVLTVVFWLTISGANMPSALIAELLIGIIYPALKTFSAQMGVPWWISGVVIDGMYLAMAWVVSVMLPPMAIFFPL
ncbi:MAG: ferrous iron transporter B, partial [Calditrichae bacterium]|nr:ferrous iron transporter B [Calditrichia bacterium]